MASKELEKTRRYEVSDFPPGTRMLLGDRRDLDAALARPGVRAVGKFQPRPGGLASGPVVYVSRRAQSFHVRHRWLLGIAGAILTLAAIVIWGVLSIGLWGFVGLMFAILAGITLLNRLVAGGGRHRVSVTTTTTTNVRVR